MSDQPIDALVAGLRKDFAVAADLVRAVLAEHEVVLGEQAIEDVTFLTFMALRAERPTNRAKQSKALGKFHDASQKLLAVYDDLDSESRAAVEAAWRRVDPDQSAAARPPDRKDLRELLVCLSRPPMDVNSSAVRRRGSPRKPVGELSLEMHKALCEGGLKNLWICAKVISKIMIAANLSRRRGATEAMYDRLKRTPLR